MGKRFAFAQCCVVLVALSLPSVAAQDSLTISLETPGLEDRAAQQSPASVAGGSTYTTSAQVQDAKQATVGRLGSVSVAKATIYAQRNPKSKTFAVCPKDTPLAIVGEIGEWYGVLMIDGSTGWIQRKQVELLDYQLVKARAADARARATTSRGGEVDRSLALAGSAVGNEIVQDSFRYMGVPYVWGGTSDNGLDCSGFVQKVCAQSGIRLPRTSREQAVVGASVPYSELEPGDRLYFACKGSVVDHCGIYIGNGLFIHSSVGRGGVAIDQLAKPFWTQTLVAARR